MVAIVGKASLVGHSDNNAAEDTGHLHVTECNNVSIFGAYGSVRTGFASKSLYKTYYFALHRTLILFPIQYWLNIGSRTPSLRYGVGHVYNSYFKNMNTGIDTRDGAQILVQSNVFSNVTEPIAALYSDDTG